MDLFVSSANHLAIFFQGSTPLLEKLVVDVEDDDPDNSPLLDLSEAIMPKLRHIDVTDANVRFGTFSRLQHLHINDYPIRCPSVQEFMQLLRDNPGLESTALTGSRPSSTQVSYDLTPIPLPRLEHLSLKYLQESEYAPILSSVRTPNLRYFGTSAPTYTISPTSLTPILRHMLQVMRPSPSQKYNVKISFCHEATAYYLSTYRDRVAHGRPSGLQIPCNVALEWPASIADEHLKLITDTLFPHLSGAEVVVELKSARGGATWKIQWLSIVPRITTLTLEQTIWATQQSAVLQYLSTPGQDGWPCPELTRLNTDSRLRLCRAEVLEMVIKRYRDPPSGGYASCKPLEMLTVKTYESYDTWGGIVDIVGEGKVVLTADPDFLFERSYRRFW